MALKEIPVGEGNQLTFPLIELAVTVREILGIESLKKGANEAWNLQLKVLKARLAILAQETDVGFAPAGTRKGE